MHAARRACLVLLAAAVAGGTADPVVQQLFNQARDKVIDNARRTPRYTCVQNITRTEHAPEVARKGASCATLIAARRQSKILGNIISHDRVRLDVAIVNGSEMFSWAGAGRFETKNIDDLIEGGSSGSGDFAAFLLSVFGGEADKIVYQGLKEIPQGRFALFSYIVPIEKSQYTYHTSGASKTLGYSGTFLIDPDNGELQRLTVETDEFPAGEGACVAEDAMDYHRVKIGGGEFLLPEVTTMDVLFRNGAASHNETVYSDCREFAGETTIHFDDVDPSAATAPAKAALPPLPARTTLHIALAQPIDTASAAAGDEVVGAVLQDVKDKSGVIAHRNDRVRGRILQMEQVMGTTPRWVVAIRFDTIERNGQIQPISLRPLDDGTRSPEEVSRGQDFGAEPRRPLRDYAGQPSRVQNFPVTQRPPGAGVFIFPGRGDVVIDAKFQSQWETR
jgi:hypothetical protein